MLEVALAKICGSWHSIINQSINQLQISCPHLRNLLRLLRLAALGLALSACASVCVCESVCVRVCVLTSHVSRVLFNYCARVCWLTNIALTANELSAFVCPLSLDRSRRASEFKQ